MSEQKLSNKQKSWKNKVATLASMGGSIAQKRDRALHQMNMNGDEWAKAKAELGNFDEDKMITKPEKKQSIPKKYRRNKKKR